MGICGHSDIRAIVTSVVCAELPSTMALVNCVFMDLVLCSGFRSAGKTLHCVVPAKGNLNATTYNLIL